MMRSCHRERVCFQIATVILSVNAIRCEIVQKELGVRYFGIRTSIYQSQDSNIRFARLRCLQQHPAAETVNYSDTHDTHCFLQCVLYKTGLMDLHTRGLDSSKFQDIWDDIEEANDEKCLKTFDFDEPLSGQCSDYYRKLMEFRGKCSELFEYTFSVNSTWKSKKVRSSKSVGEAASEFCDCSDSDAKTIAEDSESQDVPFLSQYQTRLQCTFQNNHYLDAYGRVDESELILSYREADADTADARAAIKLCTHRANAKYSEDYAGDLVLELQTCLKKNSPAYLQVARRRDDISRGY